MDPIQFGSYRFEGHPRTIAGQEERTTVRHLLPGKGSLVEPLATGARTIRLEGELYGATPEEAMAAWQQLRQLYLQGEEALLFLPGEAPFPAVFTRLDLSGEGDGRILQYRADFQAGSLGGWA